MDDPDFGPEEAFETATPAKVNGHAYPEHELSLIRAVLGDPDGVTWAQVGSLSADALLTPTISRTWRSLRLGIAIDDPVALMKSARLSFDEYQHLSLGFVTSARASIDADAVRRAYQSRRVSEIAAEMARNPDAEPNRWADAIGALTDAHIPAKEKLASHFFTGLVEIPEPKPIYSLAHVPVLTPGNLLSLLSQAKSGKSACVEAMLGAAMALPGATSDTLGFSGSNTKSHALIHFDTEQSKYHWDRLIRRALRRVGLIERPQWLLSYHFTGLPADECRLLLETALKQAKAKFGGIFGVLIDGTADLVNDVNAPEECNPLITKLHALAIDYDCGIVNVIHQNPGSDAKARGHLGSQLERKSESNLTLEKSESGIVKIWATKQRGKMIEKDKAPCFRWDDELKMHVTATSEAKNAKGAGAPKKGIFSDFVSCFPIGKIAALRRPQIYRLAEAKKGISTTTFTRYLDEWLELGLVAADESEVNCPKYYVP